MLDDFDDLEKALKIGLTIAIIGSLWLFGILIYFCYGNV